MSVYLTLSASFLEIIVSSVLVTVHLLVEVSTSLSVLADKPGSKVINN